MGPHVYLLAAKLVHTLLLSRLLVTIADNFLIDVFPNIRDNTSYIGETTGPKANHYL